MNTFIALSFLSFLGFAAVIAGLVVVLKKRGFFSSARDQAAQTLKDAATDAVNKVLK